MWNSNKDLVIKCPSCGCEYLPGEIYLPNVLIGQPKDVERDCMGTIITYDGNHMELEETYKCDKCSKSFKVKANISFMASIAKELNFDEEYAQPLYAERIHLDEN